ncbi:hypothetical protein Y032_0362g3514 [Ancylostoma ceylanicum]|uniref:Ubiquitin-like protein 5 n=1 Tax=Ancylostoma ceylanicum TaxID=53326 RepID=A0A016RWI2_9BILA|nr:hypothetical protein Y032_0362g3514 [Ancylostoma ceylanicum]
MIEITVNDRLGKKVRIKCNPTDTIGDLKKLIAAQTGTRKLIAFSPYFWHVTYSRDQPDLVSAHLLSPLRNRNAAVPRQVFATLASWHFCVLSCTRGFSLVRTLEDPRHEKIVLKKWYTIYKDHITLQDYEIHEGFNFELYYQ